ncbi:MAG TPA: hypothetical protein DCM60_08985 [Nitrospina sp.]|nr:hypothetical protein [Nitrospina sp.]
MPSFIKKFSIYFSEYTVLNDIYRSACPHSIFRQHVFAFPYRHKNKIRHAGGGSTPESGLHLFFILGKRNNHRPGCGFFRDKLVFLCFLSV